MVITCLLCKTKFKDRPGNKRRFCSVLCFRTHRKGRSLKPPNYIHCKTCRKKFIAKKWSVTNRGKKYCSVECRYGGQSEERGPLSHNWRGGVTPLNTLIRHSLEYKLWRQAVFERDNYTCRRCGTKGGKLRADHIKYFSLFPELRLELTNGQTLCFDCHAKKTKKDMKFIAKEVRRKYAQV